MMQSPEPPYVDLQRIRKLGVIVIATFWLLQFAENTFVAYLEDGSAMPKSLLPRFLVMMAGVVISYALVEVTVRGLQRSFGQRLLIVVAASSAAWMLIARVNFLMFGGINDHDSLAQVVWVAFIWSWFMYSLGGAILAIAYYTDLRDRDLRLIELTSVAREAQLRSLRYQLNPHFLFNTLNSVASLISEDKVTAERMIESLSDYLRSSLKLDPLEEITLEEELALQKLYLDIEMLRFPDRLQVKFDIPERLRRVLVPSLIMQPLFENAVRHAVARSRTMVSVRVIANERAGMLEIGISDRGGSYRGPAASGTGVGLQNVAARLRTLYGPKGSMSAASLTDGGYGVTLTMPAGFRP